VEYIADTYHGRQWGGGVAESWGISQPPLEFKYNVEHFIKLFYVLFGVNV